MEHGVQAPGLQRAAEGRLGAVVPELEQVVRPQDDVDESTADHIGRQEGDPLSVDADGRLGRASQEELRDGLQGVAHWDHRVPRQVLLGDEHVHQRLDARLHRGEGIRCGRCAGCRVCV